MFNQKEYMKEYNKKYAEAHPEKLAGIKKRHYERNKETIIHRSKEFKINNPTKVKGYKDKYRKNNPDKLKSNQMEYRKKNPNRRREESLRLNYGITIDDYNNMLTSQLSGCGICNNTIMKTGKTLGVDHNHKTGDIRELLCNNCNTILGLAKEDPKILINAAMYLLKHRYIK